jgi:hypothetical protein
MLDSLFSLLYLLSIAPRHGARTVILELTSLLIGIVIGAALIGAVVGLADLVEVRRGR